MVVYFFLTGSFRVLHFHDVVSVSFVESIGLNHSCHNFYWKVDFSDGSSKNFDTSIYTFAGCNLDVE